MDPSSPGGASAMAPARKRRRCGSNLIGLIMFPVGLGFLMGLILVPVEEGLRNTILGFVNVIWIVIIRDFLGFAPGRWMCDAKLVSLVGDKVSLKQALIRNVFLFIPVVLMPGVICEAARIYIPKILWRRVSYGVALALTLALGIPTAIATPGVLLILGVVGSIVAPIIFLVLDKEGLNEGNRLMDGFAQTRVVLTQ